MNEMNEIKLPKGVDRIAVKQHDDRIVIEFIPKEPEFKRGDILVSTEDPGLTVIFDKTTYTTAFDSIYNNWKFSNHDWRLKSFRHATKEEKQEFFDKLKADGKRWNAEKLIVEDIPQPVEELKKGDLAIFWDNVSRHYASVRIFGHLTVRGYCDISGVRWDNAIKFESKEQYEKILIGEI